MEHDNENFDEPLEELYFADDVRYPEADRPDWTLVSKDENEDNELDTTED